MKVAQAFMFEAAHHLPNVPEGHRCKRMHGHSYRVELTFSGDVDPHTGFVVDFFDVERDIGPVIAELDHRVLNDVPGLENPTAENIAAWIAGRVKAHFAILSTVRVYETASCWAELDMA